MGENEKQSHTPSGGSGDGSVGRSGDQGAVSAERVLDGLFAFVGVLSVDGVLLQANRAPLAAAGISAGQVIGKPFWDCYWWDYDPAVQASLRDAVRRCAAGETVRHDVDVRMAGDSRMRIDFMLAPSRAPDGTVTHLIASGVDVSQRQAAESALRESEGRLRFALSSAGAAIWDWYADRGETYWSAEHWDLYGIGPDVTPSYENWLGSVLAEDRARAEAQIVALLEGRSDVFQIEFRIRHPHRGIRWLLGWGRGERAADGRLHRLSGITLDITDRKQAEQDLRLLMAEVDHRAKNMLAVVQAMLRLTKAGDIDDYRSRIEGRVGALARAHTHLADARWRGVDLHRLLRAEMASRTPAAADRVVLAGPAVLLAADTAQAAAMALHELADNALRHGALSVPEGRLEVDWTIGEEGLKLHWRESGGPALAADAKPGFGTIVIDRSIGQQLSGTIERTWLPDGLDCTILLPPANLAETHGPPAPEAKAPPKMDTSRQRSRVLVVEDTHLVAMELEQILSTAGYEVVGPAMSLEKGLQLAGQERIDAAVLDVNLAGKLVFPLAERLEQERVPVLFCTGYDRQILAGSRFDSHPCLGKPFAAATLLSAVRDLLISPRAPTAEGV